MTLGQFRKWTESFPDDVEIYTGDIDFFHEQKMEDFRKCNTVEVTDDKKALFIGELV